MCENAHSLRTQDIFTDLLRYASRFRPEETKPGKRRVDAVHESEASGSEADDPATHTLRVKETRPGGVAGGTGGILERSTGR